MAGSIENADAAVPTADERARCTRSLRLIWAAMLSGQAVLAVVLVQVLNAPPAGPPLLAWLPFGVLGLGLPGAYFVRNQLYKQHWRGHAVAPQGYVAGNLVVFALLEGVVILGLVLAGLGPAAGPPRAAAVAALVLLLLNFPSGRPLEASLPELGTRSERGGGGAA